MRTLLLLFLLPTLGKHIQGQEHLFIAHSAQQPSRVHLIPSFVENKLTQHTKPSLAFHMNYPFLQLCLNMVTAECLSESQLDSLDLRDVLSRSCVKIYLDHQGKVHYAEYSLLAADTTFLPDSTLQTLYHSITNLEFKIEEDTFKPTGSADEQSNSHFIITLPLYVKEPILHTDNLMLLPPETIARYFKEEQNKSLE